MRAFISPLLVFSVIAAPTQARPRSPTPRAPVVQTPGALCEGAVVAAERSWHLPPGLLPAIARVESGRPDDKTGQVKPWPWAINVEGVGYFFPTEEDAVGAVQEFQARGVRSIDVGCMQVNLMHHPTAFADLNAAFDPSTNALYAGRFLTSLYGQAGSWPVAAAFYHSQTPDLADEYRHRVMLAWGQPDLDPPVVAGKASPVVDMLPAYRDFQPETTVFGAFASKGEAYGAFAPLPPPGSRTVAARTVAARKGPTRSPRPERFASTR